MSTSPRRTGVARYDGDGDGDARQTPTPIATARPQITTTWRAIDATGIDEVCTRATPAATSQTGRASAVATATRWSERLASEYGAAARMDRSGSSTAACSANPRSTPTAPSTWTPYESVTADVAATRTSAAATGRRRPEPSTARPDAVRTTAVDRADQRRPGTKAGADINRPVRSRSGRPRHSTARPRRAGRLAGARSSTAPPWRRGSTGTGGKRCATRESHR